MNEEEFRQKLKALCLNYDLENGSFPENEYEGMEFYINYCEKNGIEVWRDAYKEELDKLRGVEPHAKNKKAEYLISNEPVEIGDLISVKGSTFPIGIVSGIHSDELMCCIDGFNTVMVKKEGVYKLEQREVEDD
jgi:hypothetical protein